MYLLTFATLIIGLLGVYGQVLAIQTARIAAQQSGLAAAMMTWQAAAVSMASSIITSNPGAFDAVMGSPPYACSLSYNAPSGLGPCPAPANTGDAAGTVTNSARQPNLIYISSTGRTACVHLPASCVASGSGCSSCISSYDATDYQFYAVLYRNGATGNATVMTFVPPASVSAANPAPGLLQMAGGNLIGFTQADLARQLQNITPGFAYGTVSGGQLRPSYSLMSGGVYTVPTGVPDGALAVVGTPGSL